MKKVAVIGAGTMGNGIAHVLAMSGIEVNLIDISGEALTKALSTIDGNLARMVSKGRIETTDQENTLKNIQTFQEIKDGVTNVDMVIEAATENKAIKLSIFKTMDECAPHNAVLATNTSSISITEIAAVTSRPDKVIGMHFMNPVPIMKLVEIINGYKTSDATTKTVVALTEKLNKIPIAVNDYPGFIANRILMPMINEAIYALYEGVAGVAEIDQIMQLGMAHPMGPLKLADFIGLDVCLAILNVLHDGLGQPKYAPCPLLVNMVNAGNKGIKSKEGFYDYSESNKSTKVSPYFT